MLKERDTGGFIIVERHHFIQDREISGLFDVGSGACNQPQRVIVEPGTDVGIASLGQRLVLMIGAAVRKLGRRDINNPFARLLRNQVDKPQKILVGIAEAHPAADA